MSLVNVMETYVRNKLEEMLEKAECCKCEACKGDMMAIALNGLPAKYVNTPTGELYSRIESLTSQNMVDIEISVAKAINVVSKRPRHMAGGATAAFDSKEVEV